MIDEASGRRAGLFCWGRPELFLTGTAPEERCGPDWFADKPKPDDEAAGHEDSRQQRRRSGSSGGFFQRLRNIVGDLTPG